MYDWQSPSFTIFLLSLIHGIVVYFSSFEGLQYFQGEKDTSEYHQLTRKPVVPKEFLFYIVM